MNDNQRAIRPAPNKLVGWTFEDELLRRTFCRNVLGFIEKKFEGVGVSNVGIVRKENYVYKSNETDQ